MKQHGNGGVHGLDDTDVRVLEEELEHGSSLGLGERILAGAGLGPAAPREVPARQGPPVLGVIAVQVQPADPVLVEPTVAVVVDAFAENPEIPLAGPDPLEEARRRIGGVEDEFPLARFDLPPHLEDEPVAVEVLAGVFVEQAVPIVVIGTDRAPVRLGRLEIELRAVGVVLDAHVEGRAVDEPGDFRVPPVIRQHVVDEPERGFRGRDLPGMAVALDEHGRLVRILAGGLVGDRQLPDLAAFETPADGIKVDELRIILRPLFQEGEDLAVGMVMREIQNALRPGLGPGIIDFGEKAGAVPEPADDMPLRGLRPAGGQGQRRGGRQGRENQEPGCFAGHCSSSVTEGEHKAKRARITILPSRTAGRGVFALRAGPGRRNLFASRSVLVYAKTEINGG